MSRPRQEHGFAVPLALAIIAIIAGFSAVAIALATHNVDRSSRDRLSVRALAAADAGLDAAAYRMNKALVASRVDGLVPGGIEALLEETEEGCVELGVGSMSIEYLGSDDCSLSDSEAVDETVDDDGLGPSATFRYWIKSVVGVGTDNVVERRIVSVGEADGVVRRVMGVYRLDLAPPATTLFSRVSYVECTATVPDGGSDPTEGC
jgi:hypothetical protein